MTLKKEFIAKLEKDLQLGEGVLQGAITAEEVVEIEMKKLEIRNEDEHKIFVSNIEEAAGGKKYKEGIEVAEKRVINAVSKTFGVDLTDKAKNPDNFTTAFKEMYPKWDNKDGLTPDEKDNIIAEKQADIDKLVLKNTETENNFTQFKSDTEAAGKERDMNNYCTSLIPDKATTENHLILHDFAFKGYKIVEVEGKKVVQLNGETMKDEHQSPMKPSVVMGTFVTENKHIKVDGGSGGGDDPGNGAKGGLADFDKEWTANNPEDGIGGLKYQTELNKRIADKTLVLG